MVDRTDEARALLGAPDDDLYVGIAAHLGGVRSIPPARATMVERGKQWFESRIDDIATLVCADERIKLLSRQDVPTHELVVTVAGALDLGAHFLGSAPIITVSVLVVRLGLHRLCATKWNMPEPLG